MSYEDFEVRMNWNKMSMRLELGYMRLWSFGEEFGFVRYVEKFLRVLNGGGGWLAM